jgi:predicted RNase H-related nuclease YkuK (DUF458 family)
MKVFKKIDGTKIDVVSHTLDVIRKNPGVKIYIGSDSQNLAESTVYVTAIAYRFGNNGVHYIYNKEKVKRINDIWTRLWREAELTIEVAEWFRKKIGIDIKIELDMDYNEDIFYKSNQLISATKGWAQGLGYKVNTKPNTEMPAARAADYHCM